MLYVCTLGARPGPKLGQSAFSIAANSDGRGIVQLWERRSDGYAIHTTEFSADETDLFRVYNGLYPHHLPTALVIADGLVELRDLAIGQRSIDVITAPPSAQSLQTRTKEKSQWQRAKSIRLLRDAKEVSVGTLCSVRCWRSHLVALASLQYFDSVQLVLAASETGNPGTTSTGRVLGAFVGGSQYSLARRRGR